MRCASDFYIALGTLSAGATCTKSAVHYFRQFLNRHIAIPFETCTLSERMNARICTEGRTLGFKDYFRDYKKGTLTFHLELDDPFEFRRELPNIAIMGGLTTDLLSSGTPEECVKQAKLLCDELAQEGGFILSENKMMSYRNDCNSENYLELCNFMRDYRI